MRDAVFIKEMLKKGKEAKDKVAAEFSGITSQQLNWKPLPGSWSIGQCLDHLITADSSYFPDFTRIAEGNYKMSAWEKWSPFSNSCGRILVNRLQEQVKKKMTAPKVFRASENVLDTGIPDRFLKHHDTFMDYITRFANTDIDNIIITSPSIKLVTYSLRDALKMLVSHEHRHINQAIRVKQSEGFPK